MKWIKKRQSFLNEAKIRDVILPRQSKEVKYAWGEKYLDYEEITPTDKIKQGKWKLDNDDKLNVLGKFFNCDMGVVFKVFEGLPDKFMDILSNSIDISLITTKKEKYEIILKDFNILSPTIDQIVIIYDNIFRKLSVGETSSTEIIQKDENGRPVMDEKGNRIKIQKEAGSPIYSNNLVNINSFITDYNRCYPDDKIESNRFDNREINRLRSMAKDNVNSDYKIDFEILNRDLYLVINHNPKDILNISISTFYSSCQHLYNGGYRSQLLSNVFDPNSIPAYLSFDSKIFWNDEKISDFLPLSRMFIRNIESFDDTSEVAKIFFDRAYPDRMKDIFGEIIPKYSDNVENVSDTNYYYYTPDIEPDDRLSEPYMDRLHLKKTTFIGVNTKTLYLNKNYDWSKVKVSPHAKIKELIIETTDIPSNLLDIKIDLEWVKFKYLQINTFKNFENIKTDSIAFDKCKIDSNVFLDINKINPNIKKLQIISSDVDNFDISLFKNLEELHIIYTLDSLEELKDILENTKLKKLTISGDLIKDKESKTFINSLKSKIKIDTIGPVI